MYLRLVTILVVVTVAQVFKPEGDGSWWDVLLPGVFDDSSWWIVSVLFIYFVSMLLSIQLFGQTVGKFLMGLRVVDESGAPALNRPATKYELLAPFSLDSWYRYQTFQWSDHRRIWADRLAGTALIHGKPPDHAESDRQGG